jgi:DNA (cytosine-5)-methyltransferase 1
VNLTHASFFSGVGGLDMGLERAGWTTVSFSEIDPYASAVLARHWPGVPNLGSIVDVVRVAAGQPGRASDRGRVAAGHRTGSRRDAWHTATLWTGGFPCQDLSVAGKRRGMGADTRSGLAYAFLDLVERHRPPAILLENVPGLLSSHRGRDFHALQRRMAELGYVGAYRILDARYFGVPQRRRRVFIVALDARRGATEDDAAEVLSVGSRCDRHPATGGQAGPGAPDRSHVGTVPAGLGHHGHAGTSSQAVAAGHVIPVNHDWDAATSPSLTTSQERREHPGDVTYVVTTGSREPAPLQQALAQEPSLGRPEDSGGQGVRRLTPTECEALMGWPAGHTIPLEWNGKSYTVTVPEPRAPDGLAGRLDDRAGVEGSHAVAMTLRARPNDPHAEDLSSYAVVSPTLLAPGPEGGRRDKVPHTLTGPAGGPDPLLPLGLDSHRYRCCGNGVVAPVAEFVGERLRAVVGRLVDLTA